MFISKKNRLAVYQYLFKEGTIVGKKDYYAEKHSDALPIPNLEVLKLLQSFKSKGYVTETFNWQWYYYYLTNEGIAYLREYLGLPDDIVPATLKVSAAAAAARQEASKNVSGGEFKPKFEGEGGFGRGGNRGDRDSYRRSSEK